MQVIEIYKLNLCMNSVYYKVFVSVKFVCIGENSTFSEPEKKAVKISYELKGEGYLRKAWN